MKFHAIQEDSSCETLPLLHDNMSGGIGGESVGRQENSSGPDSIYTGLDICPL